ncbi:MAG: NFACT RNA binding domain-containing protein [Planctomycetaceae bacterium]
MGLARVGRQGDRPLLPRRRNRDLPAHPRTLAHRQRRRLIRLPLRDLQRAAAEMASLAGLSVDNIYQCDPRRFLLRLGPDKTPLLVDAHPGRARMLVTDAPPPVPQSPPVLGTIFRRALRGGRVVRLELLGGDRIFSLEVETAEGPRMLLLEALPRHPNLLLLDGDGVVLRLLDGEAAKHRGNPIGSTYKPPPVPKFLEEASLLPADLPGEPFAVCHALDRLAREEEASDQEGRGEGVRAKEEKKLRRRQEAVEADLEGLSDPEELRARGRLLLERYDELRTGMTRFEGIDLDPRLSPQENVDRLFKLAQKSERAKPILEERLADVANKLEGLADADLPRQPPPARRSAPPTRLPYREFTSRDGLPILVGKGGADNDELTLRIARPQDLFLHVRGTPGAHVIVPLDKGQELPQETLLDAASLALHYSKSKLARTADVTYTFRRNVSKPRGSKPGLVQVRQEKVFRLRREPERLARLLATAGGGE